MKKHHVATLFLHLLTWSHMVQALAPYYQLRTLLENGDLPAEINGEMINKDNIPYQGIPIDLTFDLNSDEDFNPDDEFGLELYNPTSSSGHHISKRGIITTAFFSFLCAAFLFICFIIPVFAVYCFLHCLLLAYPFLLFLFFILPQLTLIICSFVSTIFPAITVQVYDNKHEIISVTQFVKFFNVKPTELAGWGKTAANALMITLIKNAVGEDFELLKEVVAAIEREEDEIGQKRMAVARAQERENGRLTSIYNHSYPLPDLSIWGDLFYMNPKCRRIQTAGVTSYLAEMLVRKPCLTDLTLPGYFVFNRAPSVAWTKPILPILRAYMMPLFLLTGVKCCIIQWAKKKKRYPCLHKYDLFNKPHGLPETNGPTDVCGSIPDTYTPEGTTTTERVNDTMPTEGPCDPEGGYDFCSNENGPEITTVDYSSYEYVWNFTTAAPT